LQYLEKISIDPEADMEGIIDENGNMTGLILVNPETEESPEFRAIFTDLVSSSPVPNQSSRQFSGIAKALKLKRTYTTTAKEFKDAIIEYYSKKLVDRELCDNCPVSKEPYNMVYIESRNDKLNGILERFKLEGEILEICCGNGMSTLPLHKKGYRPLAIDNDKCQICQGLEHDVLDPERTIVLDATRLSEYFKENSFDTIAGFMLGMIYPYNRDIWERMMLEAVKVLKPGGMILLTVNGKDEVKILQDTLEKADIRGRMIDNTDEKGIYDQWVYIGTKQDAA
jgi:SAM-dependent methyltransferase